jgi:DNA-binding MarR family transcriptional regulator
MNEIQKYIKERIGIEIHIRLFDQKIKSKLPFYLISSYELYDAHINNNKCILLELKQEVNFTISQIESHVAKVNDAFHVPVIVCFEKIEAYKRKRLIEKKINFIVPFKQIYIPQFFIDLNEVNEEKKVNTKKFNSMAQLLVLNYILDKNGEFLIENMPFKNLAEFFQTNPMSITRAVERLEENKIIKTHGSKEKYIAFEMKRNELWKYAIEKKLFINPVIKQYFTDSIPSLHNFINSNISALTEYSMINPSKTQYYAIEKNQFYALKKKKEFSNLNEYEGKYCLELWQYAPYLLSRVMKDESFVVDPLSLYLSLKDEQDERIEMALDQIIGKYIW